MKEVRISNQDSLQTDRVPVVSMYKNQRKSYTYQITQEVRMDMQKRLTPNQVLLFTLGYLQRSLSVHDGEGASMNDDAMAHFMGWKERKIKDTRLGLQKAGYFLQARTRSTGRDGLVTVTTYLGERAVANFLEKVKAGKEVHNVVSDFKIVENVIDVSITESAPELEPTPQQQTNPFEEMEPETRKD